MSDTDIDLSDRNSFAFWTPVGVRYSDQDELGHINNCSYAAYVEAGRIAFLGGLLDRDIHPGIDFILAKLSIDYLREGHFPGDMKVGSRILKLGNKSMTTGYGLFLNGECKATSECVNIYFRPETRETIVIPPDIRTQLEADPTQASRAAGAGKANR
ncbi:MAG: acyl-CoA thioesterase [Rhodospirillaceae bacterium]|jgi:acyl-CoA thioester hydrolase|nr:acyl-CoA thioesterase [Rhodospirillaceae bacterium]